MPNSYLLRDLTPQESRDFQTARKKARKAGRSLRWTIGRLVGLYAEHGLSAVEKAAQLGVLQTLIDGDQ